MVKDEPSSDKASPAVAIFGLIMLGGLLAVPITFIVYGAGGGIGGLMLLGILIACQLAAYGIAQLLLGGVAAIGSRILKLFRRR